MSVSRQKGIEEKIIVFMGTAANIFSPGSAPNDKSKDIARELAKALTETFDSGTQNFGTTGVHTILHGLGYVPSVTLTMASNTVFLNDVDDTNVYVYAPAATNFRVICH